MLIIKGKAVNDVVSVLVIRVQSVTDSLLLSTLAAKLPGGLSLQEIIKNVSDLFTFPVCFSCFWN